MVNQTLASSSARYPKAGIALSGLGLWITDGVAEVDAIFALGCRNISIPWELFQPEGVVEKVVVPAVQRALALGMNVRVPFHCDYQAPLNAYAPFEATAHYLAEVQDACLALRLAGVAVATAAIAGVTAAPVLPTPGILTIEIGNEIIPLNQGDTVAAWAAVRDLYASLWRDCALAVRQHLPYARVAVPAPFDQQMGRLAEAMGAGCLPSSYLGVTGPRLSTTRGLFDCMSVHYPFDTIAEVHATPTESVKALLGVAGQYYGLPIEVSEFSTDMQYIASTIALGFPCDCWQWIYAGEGVAMIKGNLPLQAALGFGPVADPKPQLPPAGPSSPASTHPS